MESRSCPVCHSSSFESIWSNTGLSVGACQNCGHIYSLIESEVRADYSEYSQSYDEAFLLRDDNVINQLAKSRLEYVKAFTPGEMLEIGCAYGHFLHLMAKHSWRVRGVEPSVVQSRFARQHFDLEVENALFHEAHVENNSLDLIAAFHVLEHLEHPLDFLIQLRSKLKPGGHVIIAVPNVLTLPHDFTEFYYIAKGWHRHTFHPDHVKFLLRRAGLMPVFSTNEPTTTMSPSSYLIVANKIEQFDDDNIPHTNSEDYIRNFFHSMAAYKLKLRDLLKQWHEQEKIVTIYGGGLHTRAVIELCEIGARVIDGVIDDDLGKQGQQIADFHIFHSDDARVALADVFLVSSLSAEDTMLRKLKTRFPDKLAYGLYRDIFPEGMHR
ncbi:MAG: methyltransferase domain-containing protein [Gammaproteobacteria bacterium]|nr:methyltransferase domain-containing protein [Gammaproteobacteria bacterium]